MSVFFVWAGRFGGTSDREGFTGWATGVAEITGAGAGAGVDDDGVPPILREMVGAGRGTSVGSVLSSGGGSCEGATKPRPGTNE
jgi:hypothetical protein